MRLAAVLPRPLGSVLAIFVSSVLLVTPTSAGASAPGSNDLAPGDRLWASRYNGPADGSDAAHALGVSPDGSVVFVTGQSKGEDSDDYATVAYDAANGTRLWVARARGIAADYAYALAVSPTGAVIFVTGLSWARGSDYDYATVAYDAATGAQLWATRYDGPANRDDYASALGVSPDGSAVFVTGNSWGGASADDYATVAYDADTGAQLWATRYNGPPTNGYDAAYALEVSPDGSALFVTGQSFGGASGYDYATVAYDADTGAQLWATRYDGPGNSSDSAQALGVSPDGSAVFVTGNSLGEASSDDYATVAYAADTGAQLWATRYNGPANGSDSAYALGVSLDGSALFVTGITWGGAAENDYATVAYNAATGVQSWATRARAHGDEYAIDLGVSPTGTAVYVTGFSERDPSAPYDFGTVAYEA